ncbi:MAG: hypothetical protein HY237_15205, partial [Acidobacteria bacterium]|nr:hypothetical protein [Acidobacteriota bacterium]
MAQSYLIFDFGANEEAAQQARHRLEGWKQAFRLDKKLLLKFERSEAETTPAKAAEEKPKGEKVKGAAAKAATPKEEQASDTQHIRLIVRLDFSDHERLSHHRWLGRIPAEAPFKDAAPQI